MIPEIIKVTARELRNNSTKAEVILWNNIKGRKLQHRFNRQAPIYLFTEDSGLPRYIIADFYCKEQSLVIELDGNVHDKEDVYLLDREKEKLLEQKGIKVLRFTNQEIVFDIGKVIAKIAQDLQR